MAAVVKLRRGTSSQHSVFTGALGEISVDITKDTLRIHDGVTLGGHELALANLANTGIQATPSELNIMDGAVISTTQLNYLSDVTSNIQAQLNSKQTSASLSTVATTGAYSDITGTPTIPSTITELGISDGSNGQVLTTDGAGGFTFTSSGGGVGLSYTDLTDVPSLSPVAVTGAYTDLVATPTIPSDVSDLTDANGSLGVKYAVTGGTLDGGDANGLPENEVANLGGLSPVALSGAYTDLVATPTIPSDVSELSDSNSLLGSGSGLNVVVTGGTLDGGDANGLPENDADNLGGLSAVALSGSYNDLTDLPTSGRATNYSNEYILYGSTTNGIETEILVEGSSRIPVAENSTMFYNIDVVARRTDGGGSEGGGWHLKGSADNYSGITSDIGNLYEILVSADDANTTVDARIHDISDTLRFYVTGSSGKSFKWTAKITTVVVIG